MSHPSSIHDTLLQQLSSLSGKDILDVGCGKGDLSNILDKAGFNMTGIEPSDTCIAHASRQVPKGEFIVASAEDIPLPDNSFDACVLVNSFHHIPAEHLDKALEEFKRVLRQYGDVIIIEPLTRGSFFKTMLPVEDETEIRNHALDVLKAKVSNGAWELLSRCELDRITHFSNVEEFIDRLVSVDPSRKVVAEAKKELIEELFIKNADKTDDKFTLVQPHTIWRIKPSR